MRAAALDLMAHGIVPIPVTFRRKTPVNSAWQMVRMETVNVDAFDAKVNIGVVLGEPSAWLVDVDLDCHESVSIAPYMLQSTRIFGRDSARASHYLYRSIGAETAKFYDPVMVARKEKRKAMLVELRSTGGQTVFPPSIHELGEPIEYDAGSEDEPAVVKASTLLEEIEELAAATLFVRYGGLEIEQAVADARERRIPDGLPDLVVESVRKWLHMAPTHAPARSHGNTDVIGRARAYIAKIPGAVSGNGGHDATYGAALALCRGFALDHVAAMELLREYNQRCDPPWTEKELEHKAASAAASDKVSSGYLLNAERPATAAAPTQTTPEPTAVPDNVVSLSKHRRPLRSRSYLTAVTIIEDNARDVLDGRTLELDDMTGIVMLGGEPIKDSDESRIRSNIESKFVGGLDKNNAEIGLQIGAEDIHRAINQVAASRPYHPVQRYLSSLKWDGQPRIAAVAEDILGAARTVLNQALIRCFMVSCVARAMQPGCKVDTVLVLVGEQGIGKSTFFKIISGEWFFDSPIDIGKKDKDTFMALRCAWICEWGELEAIRRAREITAIKAFISSQVDIFRPSHGKNIIVQKRGCVFVGTTNKGEFLFDSTGNRRFMPMTVTTVDNRALREQRDQLWAESVSIYLAWAAAGSRQEDTPWVLTAAESASLGEAQHQYAEQDDWLDPIAKWIENRLSTDQAFTTGDVLGGALSIPKERWVGGNSHHAAEVLKSLGWKQEPRPRARASCWFKVKPS